MKKIFLFMSVVSFLFLTGCSSKTLKSISYDELKSKIENKETFVIYFKENDTALKDKLETSLENNNLTGYYMDASKISNDQKLELETNIAYEDNSIVFIINGTDPTKLSHITDKDITIKEITARLIDMNFIKVE